MRYTHHLWCVNEGGGGTCVGSVLGEPVCLPNDGHGFCIGKQEMSLHAQYFEYVVRPSKGSEADFRLTLELYF